MADGAGRVLLRPDELHMVDFDRDTLVRLIDETARAVGLPDDVTITVDLDETTPMGRAAVESYDPLVLSVESGAFEDAKRPRQLSEQSVVDTAGRLLLRAVDRSTPDFGDPPPDAELALEHAVAWDAYCMGRMARSGHDSQEPRRRFHFRIRHGFTDAADRAFDALWHGTDLTWADITRLADAPRATTPAP